jgi:type I restriction enzyme S subunit
VPSTPNEDNIPKGWEITTFRAVCLRTKQWNPSKEPRERFDYIDVSAVSRESCEIEQPQPIDAKTASSRARKIIHAGDCLFATIRPRLLRVAHVGPEYDNQIASTAFCILRPNPEKAVSRFLYFLMRCDFIVDAIASHESGASYPAVSDGNVLDCEIRLPPKPEQQKIAAILWKMQRAIATQDRLIAATRDLNQSAMQHLFAYGIRGEPLKNTPIGPMPENWEPRPLPELCEISSGGTPRKSMPEFWQGDIPWVSGKDLKSVSLDDTIDHVSVEGVAAGSRLAPKDSVLLLVRGMGLAKDLPVAVITRPMAFNQDIKALASRGEYSGQFIRSAIYVGKERLRSQIVPSAHGTMTLNLNDLESFLLACPSDLEEAEAIATTLATLNRKLAHHRAKRAALDALFQTLLHKLMTAEIRVADLDIDTSDVADHVPDAGKMVGGQTAPANADHFVDVNKMIGKPERSRR